MPNRLNIIFPPFKTGLLIFEQTCSQLIISFIFKKFTVTNSIIIALCFGVPVFGAIAPKIGTAVAWPLTVVNCCGWFNIGLYVQHRDKRYAATSAEAVF